MMRRHKKIVIADDDSPPAKSTAVHSRSMSRHKLQPTPKRYTQDTSGDTSHSPYRINNPLNDDQAEKEHRKAERSALVERNRNILVAATSPRKPLMDDEMPPPAKQIPIMADYEEWMKMATDNVRIQRSTV